MIWKFDLYRFAQIPNAVRILHFSRNYDAAATFAPATFFPPAKS